MTPNEASFNERIQEFQLGTCRLFVLKTEVDDVVSWKGSFVTNPVFDQAEELVQGLAVSLLDKGTLRRDRFEIADLLENRGAQVGYQSKVLRVGYSGRALRSDFPEVLDVVAESLQAPLFDADEFEKARIRMKASVQRSIDQAGTQAWLALSRKLYEPNHPNYPLSPEEELEQLDALTLDALRHYYQGHFGSRENTLVVVGDVDVDAVVAAVERGFASWTGHDAPARFTQTTVEHPPQRIPVQMPDKFNIEVRMGHPLNVYRNDDEFVPLHLANFIVGGNFSSRLMDIVRDEKGLTYGVRSRLSGVNRFYNGHWQVNITLSRDKLETGIDATIEVLEDYVRDGATEQELIEKKRTITGTFQVQLATTSGLAGTILRGIEQGFGRDYLDTFPRRVEAITLEELNNLIRRHLDPDALHIVTAGTIDDVALISQA